jgi:hypothetical protein
MKSKNITLAMVILPLILAGSFSVVLWPDASLAAKIGFFALGTWFGISLGSWLVSRKTELSA